MVLGRGRKDLDALRSRDLPRPDLVVFGCPQMTYDEAVMLGRHFVGKRVTVPTWFCMVPSAQRRVSEEGLYAKLVDAGVAILDVCPVAALSSQMGRKKILTSSGKLFYYLAGAAYGSEHDCLRATGVVT
jgi:cis-L-3-hydroxyproline dehydratase